MNTLLHRNSSSIGGRIPGSKRRMELSETHSLVLMGFFTLTGLLSVVTAIFTTMLPMPTGLRDFWLVICITAFGLLLIGITLFFLSYESKQPSTTGKR